MDTSIVLAVVLTLAVLLGIVLRRTHGSAPVAAAKAPTSAPAAAPAAEASQTGKQGKKKQAGTPVGRRKGKKGVPEHPQQHGHLRGFSDAVSCIAWSPDGSCLAVGSLDRTLRLFYAATFATGKDHAFHRINLPLDAPSAVAWSSDSHAVVTALRDSRELHVYKLGGKAPRITSTSVYQYPGLHSATVVSVAVAATGKFVLSCSEDTEVILWRIKGDPITRINTNQMVNRMAALSPDASLFSVAAFTSDVKIWTAEAEKGAEDISKTRKIMDLKGHRSAVRSVAFASGNSLVTGSKDGTWKLWDLAVRWQQGEDPRCLHTVPGTTGAAIELVSPSPDQKWLVTASSVSLELFSLQDGASRHMLSDAHQHEVVGIVWSADSTMFASFCDNERSVSLWSIPALGLS